MYKKYTKKFGVPNKLCHKIWLIMRLTTVILIASLLQVSAAGFAQKVSLSEKNSSLSEIFSKIRSQTGVDFVVSSEVLRSAKPVTIEIRDLELEAALMQLFKNQSLEYSLEDKFVVVKEKKKSFLDRVSDYFAAIDVYGKVVNENGSPLGGATITIKATGKGVTAKADGNFSITGVEEGAILVVSFMGYFPKELKATKDLGVIKLELSTSKLDEVQIQAYGKTSQRLSVSNITTIKAEEIEKQNVTNPLLALQGRVANLDIRPNNGLPNSGVAVRIQGTNSLNAGLDPLYIIDGVPYPSQTLAIGVPSPLGDSRSGYTGYSAGGSGNPMSYVNPQDIESIDVLKDASATAIYGSRAANGAIIITTKKGNPGKMKIDFSIENGRSIISKNISLLNIQQYISMRREALRNDNIIPDENNAYDILNINGWSNDRNTNWLDVLLAKKAQYTTATLGVSGGTDRSNYLISGTYNKQGANTPGNFADQKGSLHISLGANSQDQRFKMQFSGNYLYDQNLLPILGSLSDYALNLAPTAPTLYNADGSLNWGTNSFGNSTWSNPYATLKNPFRNITNNLIANLNLSYEILKNLQIRINSGYNTLASKEYTSRSLISQAPETDPTFARTANISNSSHSSWIFEPQLSYGKTIGQGKLDILLGGTVNQNSNSGSSNAGYGFSSDNLLEDIASAPYSYVASTLNTQYKYAALFMRLNYNLLGKYIIELSGRRDGSSRFGTENRYHSFGAAGLGWVFSDEKLIKNNLKFLSFGKLRFSYGTTGNDQVGDYSYLDLFAALGASMPYQNVPALQPTELFNPVLQWEETKKANFGMDLGFFKDKFILRVEHFRNLSSNTLNDLALPYTSGLGSIKYNFDSKIRNTGWELSLTSNNFQVNGFSWKTNLFFSTLRNKLLNLPSNFVTTGKEGYPINYVQNKFLKFVGVDPETGKVLYQTADGGITSNPNSSLDFNNYVDLNPKWVGGIGNSISYKSFQIDFLFSIVKKKSIGYFSNYFAGVINQNVPQIYLNRWQQPGDITGFRKFSTDYNFNDSNFQRSTGNIIDGSFIKLRNVSLSWTAPEKWLRHLKVQKFSIYTQAQNLFSFSGYQGYDPETGTSSPPTRVITFGLRTSI